MIFGIAARRTILWHWHLRKTDAAGWFNFVNIYVALRKVCRLEVLDKGIVVLKHSLEFPNNVVLIIGCLIPFDNPGNAGIYRVVVKVATELHTLF